LSGYQKGQVKDIRNVILISIDDLRFDCIGCEDDKRWLEAFNAHSIVDTPTLDNIAKEGIRFTQCISTSSYTPSSHTSMLTGLYPKRHKVKTFFNQLPKNVTTLPEILKKQGWNTRAWSEHLTFQMQDITRGIDTVIEPFKSQTTNLFEFIESIQTNQRNFIFIHLFDVHKPYLYTTGGSERFKYNDNYLKDIGNILKTIDIDIHRLLYTAQTESKRIIKNYDELNASLKEYATYRSLDYLLREALKSKNRLFEEIIPLYVHGVNKFDHGKFQDLLLKMTDHGLLENSILIIVSDHGETRCKWDGREDFMNSFNISEGAIHVPLIFYSEHLPAGLVINEDVSIIDLMATILDLLNISNNLDLDGISLKPLFNVENTNMKFDRTLFSETWAYQGKSTFFGIADNQLTDTYLAEACARREGTKYVWRNTKIGRNGYYNFLNDPFEINNVPLDGKGMILKNQLENYLLEYQIKKITIDSKLNL